MAKISGHFLISGQLGTLPHCLAKHEHTV